MHFTIVKRKLTRIELNRVGLAANLVLLPLTVGAVQLLYLSHPWIVIDIKGGPRGTQLKKLQNSDSMTQGPWNNN
jgi:hypothetical protein